MPRAGKSKSTPRRRKPRPSRQRPVERGPDVPHWLPAGKCWDKLPDDLRESVLRLIVPAYRRFVLDASNELERSIGTTLVHLMWLELCGQMQLASGAANPNSLDALLQNPEEMISRHLHLAGVKCQTAELLMKLRIINEALERPPAVARAELAPSVEILPPSIDVIRDNLQDNLATDSTGRILRGWARRLS